MIALWMLYCSFIASLLGLVALAAERVCRAMNRPTRWVWVAALAGSLLLPALLPWAPAGQLAPTPEQASITPDDAGPLARATEVEATGTEPALSFDATPALDRVLAVSWAGASALLAAIILLSASSLGRERRSWRFRTVRGTSVWVSRDTGPAVVGFLWPEIVVPERMLKWDEESQRLLLEHEAEHERAGDSHLLLLSLTALVLMPWNPPIWLQARRLRFAVEVDCDARVLRTRPCVQSYGRLLIEVGRVASRRVVPVTAFSRSRSFLERRIRILAGPDYRPRRPVLLGLWGSILLAPFAVGAIPAPAPPDFRALWERTTEPERPGTLVSHPQASDGGSLAVLRREPTFTSYEVRPELRNQAELRLRLAERVASSATGAEAGKVVFWALIDSVGTVSATRIVSGSGDPSFDRSAEEALRGVARFTPARNAGRRVPAWIQVPLTAPGVAVPSSDPGSYRLPIATSPLPSPPRTAPGQGDGLAALPYDTRPELVDRVELRQLLARGYPAARRTGPAGTAVLWAFVDAAGEVRSTRLQRSSGDEQLDLAAREALRQARFDPARSGGDPVGAWTQVPVSLGRSVR